ncbi:hypothetical protein VN97_g7002 [Penicillium thymicola]|uniref:Uncharacterized protein n=1 Tax=Penicillium thymicola TaxID=293382 RepID=A0AAI9TGG1_PENTH|nr:hypothetical protein VN97_g7002 [Penicillium thymicola]
MILHQRTHTSHPTSRTFLWFLDSSALLDNMVAILNVCLFIFGHRQVNLSCILQNATALPTNPSATMVIRRVTPDIVAMSLPFARVGHLQFGGRGTLG